MSQLILWSGGVDSTLVLADALKRNEKIRTISITHPQRCNNSTLEAGARQAIIKKLADKYKWQHLEVEVTHKTPGKENGDFEIDSHGGLIMPWILLTIAIQYLDLEEDLSVGYIRSDDAMHYLHHIKPAFISIQAVSHRTGGLNLPLEWCTKAEAITRLRNHRLLELTWHCEDPADAKRCGRCAPCMTHDTALWQLKHRKCYQLHHKHENEKLMKASELKIGNTCRYRGSDCTRVDYNIKNKIALVTKRHKLILLKPNELISEIASGFKSDVEPLESDVKP